MLKSPPLVATLSDSMRMSPCSWGDIFTWPLRGDRIIGLRHSPKIALSKGPGLWYSTCQAVSPRGRFAMLRTDLEKPLLTGPSITAGSPSRFVRLTCSGILVISCTIFGFSQCYAQDVAEAARQEQARKTSQQKKTKHVYTDEDLKRAQILTPEDRAQVEARKNQQPLPAEDQSQDSVDAQALPP